MNNAYVVLYCEGERQEDIRMLGVFTSKTKAEHALSDSLEYEPVWSGIYEFDVNLTTDKRFSDSEAYSVDWTVEDD